MSDRQPESSVPALVDRTSRTWEEPGVNEEVESPREGGGGLPSLATLLSAWKRRWFLATALGLVLAAAVGPAVWYLTPVTYTVFSLLRVVAHEPSVLPSDKAGGYDAMGLFRQTQVALVTSRPTILSALRQERVRNLDLIARQEDPAAWIERQLRVGFLDNTEILRIAMTGDQPGEMSVVVSAIEQTYLQEVVKSEQRHRLSRLDDIQKICVASEERMRTHREKLRRLAESLKTTDTQALTLRQKMMLEESALLNRELISVRAELRQLSVLIATHEERLKKLEKAELSEAQINQQLDEDRQVQRGAERVQYMEDVVSDAKERGKPGSWAITAAETELRQARKELEKVRSIRRPAAIARLRGKMAVQMRTKVDEARDRFSVLRGQEKELKDEVEHKNALADSIGITSIELDMRRGEIEQAELIIKSLRAEKERLEVEIQSSARRVTPLSADGEIYQMKNTRSRAARAGLGGGLAFLGGALLVAFWEFSRRRVHSPDEVVRDLGLKVLGALPVVPASALQARDETGGRIPSDCLWEERICDLRTALFLAGNGPPSVLMVTSAGAREGKTTLAAHLAVSIAATGRTTLLIDGDLRRPVLHRVFGVDSTPGLCEVLRGEEDATTAIKPTALPGLFLLPAGKADREALTALARDNARCLFEGLKGNFDCVVLDTSPVLPVSDALLVGQHADGVLLAVRSRVSRLPRVRAAYERLKTLNKRFVAAVVSGGHEEMDAEEYRYLIRS